MRIRLRCYVDPMRALPIDRHLDRVVSTLRTRRGLVLIAEPGAGKTTRLPRAMLDAGMAEAGSIWVVQPRRLAARMGAARVADELGEPVGRRIGYQVRFERRVSAETRVLFMTEGVLQRRLVADPKLRGVSAVVLDEVHERHLDGDLALARLRKLSDERALSLCAMSATLDARPMAAFLDAPVIEVEGRTFPLTVEHAEREDERPLERRVRAALARLLADGIDGDVLVFLPGAAEIRRALAASEDLGRARGVDLLPLHGNLPAEQQDRALRRGSRRRVVFSTNVAETSLTLEGVVAVVDSGLARVERVSPWSGMARRELVPISRAAAAQRAGRAGRTRPGRVLRLYTRRDHDRRPSAEVPEIRRADLSSAFLTLRAAGEDPRTFAYFERPSDAALQAAETLLVRLGALRGGAVTPLGRAMLALPAHPRVARIALEGRRLGYPEAAALAAALVAERDLRASARSRLDGSDMTYASVRDDEVASSDIVARVDELLRLGDRPSASALRAAGLEVGAAHTVLRARDQLVRAMRSTPRDSAGATEDVDEEQALLLAILAGFPDRLARRRRTGRELAVAGGKVATLDPRSAVKQAELMVLVDVSESRGRALVRRASAVEPSWLLERFLDDIEERTEARFDRERERVVGVSELRLDGVLIESAPWEPGDERAADALAQAALEAGIERFCDGDAVEALARRLHFARRLSPDLPELDDTRKERVLRALCADRRSFAELEDASVWAWLRADLGSDALSQVDRLAPASVSIPGRERVRVHYEWERPPWIASRLSDFFGAKAGPNVGDGQIPLLLHLLAPNQRAIQITTDLAGFWARHYREVRKELRGRYPKHPWPDDPATAEPTRRRRRPHVSK